MTLVNTDLLKLEFGSCCAWAKGGTFSLLSKPLRLHRLRPSRAVCRKGDDPLLHNTMSICSNRAFVGSLA